MVEPTGNKEPHMQSLLTLVLLIASVSWNTVPWKQCSMEAMFHGSKELACSRWLAAVEQKSIK
jgi:hypothetical protein